MLTLKESMEGVVTDMVVLNVDTHCVHNVIHILLTDELVVDFETAAMMEGMKQVLFIYAFNLFVSALITTARHVLRLRL